MTAPLVPCAACARHLRADADRCPFCDVARTPQRLAYVPVPRMARSAMAALGAVLAVAPAALGADDAEAQPHHTAPRPLYGVPPRPRPPHPPTTRDAGAAPDATAPDASTAAPHDAGAPDARRLAPRPTPRRPPADEGGVRALYGDAPKPTG